MSERDNVIPFRPRTRSRDEELADVLTDIRDSGDRARALLGELRARSDVRLARLRALRESESAYAVAPTPIAEIRASLESLSLEGLIADLDAEINPAPIPEIRTALEASGERLAAIRRDLEALAHED